MVGGRGTGRGGGRVGGAGRGGARGGGAGRGGARGGGAGRGGARGGGARGAGNARRGHFARASGTDEMALVLASVKERGHLFASFMKSYNETFQYQQAMDARALTHTLHCLIKSLTGIFKDKNTLKGADELVPILTTAKDICNVIASVVKTYGESLQSKQAVHARLFTKALHTLVESLEESTAGLFCGQNSGTLKTPEQDQGEEEEDTSEDEDLIVFEDSPLKSSHALSSPRTQSHTNFSGSSLCNDDKNQDEMPQGEVVQLGGKTLLKTEKHLYCEILTGGFLLKSCPKFSPKIQLMEAPKEGMLFAYLEGRGLLPVGKLEEGDVIILGGVDFVRQGTQLIALNP